MITVNCVSGGATSAYMAVHYEADYDIFCLVCTDQAAAKPKDPALRREIENRVPGFVASRELDSTLKLVLDLEQMIQRPITWIAALQGQSETRAINDFGWSPKVLTYDRIIAAKMALPNRINRFCTAELKLLPTIWWRYLNLPSDPVIMNIGLRFDEDKRVRARLEKCDRADFPISCSVKTKKQKWLKKYFWREQNFPLWLDGISKQDVVKFWESRGWQFPGMPGPDSYLATASSNCDFCFFKQFGELLKMKTIEAERGDWWSQVEDDLRATFIKDIGYQDVFLSENAVSLKRIQKSRTINRSMKEKEANGQGSLFGDDSPCACTD